MAARAAVLTICLVAFAAGNEFLEPVEIQEAAMPDNIHIFTKAGSLPWPLPDVNDMTTAMIHTLHCKQFKNHGDRHGGFGKVHSDHCAALVAPVEAYINQAGLMVPMSVCKVLFPQVEEQDFRNSEMGSNLNSSDTERARRGEMVHDPAAFLLQLTGYNFLQLIRKESKGVLTAAEQKYMESWKSPQVVKQAAVALSCDPAITAAWLKGSKLASEFACYGDSTSCGGRGGNR